LLIQAIISHRDRSVHRRLPVTRAYSSNEITF